MKNKFNASARIVIRSSNAGVWDALTNPAIIKQYLFGTEASSDWITGSPVTQDNIPSAESAAHSTSNWRMVLESIKKILEA